MTVGRTWTVVLTGLVGELVEVEADLSTQTPGFSIIGLPDKAIGEAQQRVRNACGNSDLPLPRRRVVVNLSPARLPKHGTGLDVAVAIAALATELPLDAASLLRTVHLGELGLDGRLRPVPGILPAVAAAADAGFRQVIVPAACRSEAELVASVDVVAAVSLRDVARHHGLDVAPVAEEAVPLTAVQETGAEGDRGTGKDEARAPAETTDPAGAADLAEVIGQDEAVESMIVAAAGGHHILMTGPPGAGKTMLARRLPGILPELGDAEALQAASLRSLAGGPITTLRRTPPFEAPHHTASVGALVGGGSRQVQPGAIARAHGGVLFLDEAGEFSGYALDALRQPLESGEIEIHRAGFRARFPARFQLVLATNPCPCGQYGVPGGACACASIAIRRYLGKLSGPLLDRVDIELAMRRVSTTLVPSTSAVTTAQARAWVHAARERAERRLRETPWRTNAETSGSWLRTGPCAPSGAVRQPLDAALQRGSLTLRGYDRVLRLAWTVADLAGRGHLELGDVGRALFLKKGAGAT